MRVRSLRRREFIAALGGAASWPRALRAQQKAMPVIGFLGIGTASPGESRLTALWQGLGDFGYVEGHNVAIEYRWAGGRYDQLPALATDLVDGQVDVILAEGGAASGLAAKKATSTIPIVIVSGDDPVASGLVESLARPGGNLTGISIITVELMSKRLELLLDLVPRAKLVALLLNPKRFTAERIMRDVEDAARAKGVQLHVLQATTAEEIDTAFAALVRVGANALLIAPDPSFTTSQLHQLVALTSRHAVPAIYAWREFPDAGGLASYGVSFTGAYRLAGIYVGKILKGAQPADLPIEQPSRFELIINLKTAKALGLTVPPGMLDLADEVIE
jgi:putative ABC transport system substrate-binding protein